MRSSGNIDKLTDYKDCFPVDADSGNNESSNAIRKSSGIYHHFGKLAVDNQYIPAKMFFCPLAKTNTIDDASTGIQNFGVAVQYC